MQERSVITKIFGLMYIFAFVAMTAIKYILPETEIFVAKLIQHEERANSSPDNLPKFNNTLVYNIKEGNDTFTFKEATSQP